MLFTTVFSLLGDERRAELWLIVARAGGLLALAMAYRLALPPRRPRRPGSWR